MVIPSKAKPLHGQASSLELYQIDSDTSNPTEVRAIKKVKECPKRSESTHKDANSFNTHLIKQKAKRQKAGKVNAAIKQQKSIQEAALINSQSVDDLLSDEYGDNWKHLYSKNCSYTFNDFINTVSNYLRLLNFTATPNNDDYFIMWYKYQRFPKSHHAHYLNFKLSRNKKPLRVKISGSELKEAKLSMPTSIFFSIHKVFEHSTVSAKIVGMIEKEAPLQEPPVKTQRRDF